MAGEDIHDVRDRDRGPFATEPEEVMKDRERMEHQVNDEQDALADKLDDETHPPQ